MKGIIIAGGYGTRLRPLTYHRPKPMLPVANRPFLEYQIALLKKHGINEVTLATNYLWEFIEAHFGDGTNFGVTIRYALEPEPLGTAGAIRNALDVTDSETVIVLNGDVLTDFDLDALIGYHRENRADATVALRAIQRPHGFGILTSDDAGRVAQWREPTEEEKKRVAVGAAEAGDETDYINAGIYILEPEFFDRIPSGEKVSIERETFQDALRDGLRVFASAPDGYWLDIGNPHQYLEANLAAMTRQFASDLPFQAFAESAAIFNGARVENSVIGPDCVVMEGANVTGSVLLEGVAIAQNVQVQGAILDMGSVIEDGAVIRAGAVIGAGTRITSGSQV